jgi:hypothetical protein
MPAKPSQKAANQDAICRASALPLPLKDIHAD